MAESEIAASPKKTVDGFPTNAFRVVGVGQDIVLETYYLYPDFARIDPDTPFSFNMQPERDIEPNLRLVMNRQTAAGLTNALLNTLNARMELDDSVEENPNQSES